MSNLLSKSNEQISELSYLTSSASIRFRPIVRFLYKKNIESNVGIYNEDLLDEVRKYTPDYSLMKLKEDLRILDTYGTVIGTPDHSRKKTVQEYKNPDLRYELSPIVLMVEEALEEYDARIDEHGSYDQTGFVRLAKRLRELIQDIDDPYLKLKEINRSWQDITLLFSDITMKTTQYFRYIQGEDMSKITTVSDFEKYKREFNGYIADFVNDASIQQEQIKKELNHLMENDERRLKIIYDAVASTRSVTKEKVNLELENERVRRNTYGKYSAMRRWFIDTSSQKQSEYSIVINSTRRKITELLMIATKIINIAPVTKNSIESYKQIAKWFYECETVEEAHCMYAELFGITQVAHYYSAKGASSSLNSTPWKDYQEEIYIDNHGKRRGKKKREDGVLLDNELENEIIQRENEKIFEIQRNIEFLQVNGRIDFSVQTFIPKTVLDYVINWITLARDDNEYTTVTDFGYEIKIHESKDKLMKIGTEEGIYIGPKVSLEILGYKQEKVGAESDA
ncbi:DUF2397 family protein [Enterococcus sp. AZ192]|uniref:DUF2397 family protein n=1 Tax=unclassified Enterococcus TaxID=2608891 RepID=UPI003D2958C4